MDKLSSSPKRTQKSNSPILYYTTMETTTSKVRRIDGDHNEERKTLRTDASAGSIKGLAELQCDGGVAELYRTSLKRAEALVKTRLVSRARRRPVRPGRISRCR